MDPDTPQDKGTSPVREPVATDAGRRSPGSRAGVWCTMAVVAVLLYGLSVPPLEVYSSLGKPLESPRALDLYGKPWHWMAAHSPLGDAMRRYYAWCHEVMYRWKYEGELRLW